MAEPDLVDPIAESRARAQLALRADMWTSFKVALWCTTVLTGGSVAAAGLLVTNQILSGWMVKWVLVAALAVGGPLAFSILEARRMYEKVLALEDLFRTIKQYEVLLKTQYAKVSTLEGHLQELRLQVSYLKLPTQFQQVPENDNPQQHEDQ